MAETIDDKVIYFQAVTGISDHSLCTEILAAHDWDLQLVVSSITANPSSLDPAPIAEGGGFGHATPVSASAFAAAAQDCVETDDASILCGLWWGWAHRQFDLSRCLGCRSHSWGSTATPSASSSLATAPVEEWAALGYQRAGCIGRKVVQGRVVIREDTMRDKLAEEEARMW
ncbi:hypothetical protein OsJ_21709 [Oryza sativa Japonica Group]|uniref:Uncharacterized protein n=1 Tax=Oryza sativa subsp. japonica TaxID=39947 RepID=A3BCT1_ORYSJ|nr:hypothetical protein OsJ_21709 [Oryza sativa Japonica Group]